jgi:hypothetical protein
MVSLLQQGLHSFPTDWSLYRWSSPDLSIKGADRAPRLRSHVGLGEPVTDDGPVASACQPAYSQFRCLISDGTIMV